MQDLTVFFAFLVIADVFIPGSGVCALGNACDANPLQRCTLCLGKTPMIMHASHTSQFSLVHTLSSCFFPQVLGLFQFTQQINGSRHEK